MSVAIKQSIVNYRSFKVEETLNEMSIENKAAAANNTSDWSTLTCLVLTSSNVNILSYQKEIRNKPWRMILDLIMFICFRERQTFPIAILFHQIHYSVQLREL